MGINLTYVGSFPLRKTQSNILRATLDVLSIPVDCPNYVQLEDMNEQFLKPISLFKTGIYWKKGNYRTDGNISVPKKDFKSAALETLLKLSKEKRFSTKVRKIKASVTGPFTLASKIIRDKQEDNPFGDTLLHDVNLIKDLSDIVCKIAQDFQKAGADYITIDEPILSVIVGNKLLIKNQNEEEIVEIIDNCYTGIKCLKGLHVCGRLSRKLVEILLKTDVDILDHEFKDTPENFSVFGKKDFSDDKKLSLGLASSKRLQLETVDEIVSLLNLGIKKFGVDNIEMIKPDCGFRGLDPNGSINGSAYKSSIGKLRNLRITLDSL